MATQNESTEDMNARRIVGSVTQGGRAYVAGDEDKLAGVLPQANLDNLVERGVLAGDWSTSSRVEGGEPATPAEAPPAPRRARKPAAKKAAPKTATKKPVKTATKSARKSASKTTTKKRGR